MYIKRLFLKNIRCFENLEINFDRPGSSILLLGGNGDGKSTILKSIAMGLCDESSAAALFRELQGEFVRRQPGKAEVPTGESGFIEIDLVDKQMRECRTKTIIFSLKKFERLKQELSSFEEQKWQPIKDQDKFPWERIFVSAYGAGVRTNATSDFQHYLPVDAVYPLFNYSSQLQNPELVIHRLLAAARSRVDTSKEKDDQENEALNKIKNLMAHLLDLESPDSFALTPTGIKVTGHWGTAELSELSDGYQSVINWVLDLLSWWFLRENGKSRWELSSLRGIVLIDEIEQHLHPKWQRAIFPRLREKFPNIQFIVATHSPLVATANPDIDVHLLNKGQQRVINPFGWLAEDIYEEMGLASSRSIEFEDEILKRYKELTSKKLTAELTTPENEEFGKLKKILKSMPESDPIALSLDLQSITNNLKKLTMMKNEKRTSRTSAD